MTEERASAKNIARTLVLLALLACLAAAVATGATSDLDSLVRNGVHQGASPALTALMSALTHLGSMSVLAVLFVVGFAGFRMSGRRSSAWVLAWAMGGAILLENGLKYAFQRARPEPFFGVVAPETYSFPSGHALFSACFYGAIAWVLAAEVGSRPARAAIWTGAIALIAAIGFSRVYLGVHYPSDVLGGYLTAAFWISAVSLWDGPGRD
jgi:undecaprenyl-diphosphatase